MEIESLGGRPSRRLAERYPLQLRVELPDGIGRTRDVSTAGVYLVTDRWYGIGESMEFTLVFPEPPAPPPVRLRCQGTVVRVEPREAEVGLAVMMTSSAIVPAE